MVVDIIISVVLLFTGIAVLVVIHVCIVGRAFRRSYDMTITSSSISNHGLVSRTNGAENRLNMVLTNEKLKNLPCFIYNANPSTKEEAEKAGPSVDCAVCLESFNAGESCRLLPNCNHSFHSQCIDLWLLNMPLCPICRTGIHLQKLGAVASEERHVSHDVVVELT